MPRSLRHLFVLLSLLLSAPHVHAHAGSNAYLQIDAETAALSVRWDLALRDLDFVLGLDRDGDGNITWGETRAAGEAIRDYAQQHLTLSADGRPCLVTADKSLQIADREDGRYAVLSLKAVCSAAPQALQVDYQALFDIDASHRAQVRVTLAGASTPDILNGVLAPDRRSLNFKATASSFDVLRQYLHEGIWHVWTGWDHMLFLTGLFLPAVLRRRGGQWLPVGTLREAVTETAKIVTAFTIAHAATLCLAALGILHLPTRLVESLVAATVLFAGLNNLIPMVHQRLMWLAGFFGLIHGSAIAGALLELGLPATGRVWSLLGFNLGVEIAQLSLVAVIVPLTFVFRHSVLYRRLVLVPGSLLVAVAGSIWLINRAFAMNWPLPI